MTSPRLSAIRPANACLAASAGLILLMASCTGSSTPNEEQQSDASNPAASETTSTASSAPASTPIATDTKATTPTAGQISGTGIPLTEVDLSSTRTKGQPEAGTPINTPGAVAAPISFSPDPLDMGEMTAGVAKTTKVTLTNTSSKPVTITKAIPGCGCTTLGWPKDPIAPGESADIDITLKPGPKQGIRLRKRVTFQIEGHPSQVLNVEGDVAAYVTIKPDIVSARTEGTDLSEDIILTSADGTTFVVESVEPAITAAPSTDSALEHTLNIDWNAWEEAGRPVKIAFKLDHPKASQVTALIKRRPNQPSLDKTPRPATPAINDLSGAARAGDATRVKLLLADGRDPNQADTAGGRTALHWAVRSGNTEIVDLLIANGADLNKGDQAGKTPLSHAAESGNIELTGKLLAAGADVNKRDLVGGNSVLWASGLGTADTLRLLVESGGEVDVKDINGLTPLAWAAQTGKTDSMKILIEGGADVNATDNLSGESILMRAARSGKTESIKLLIENGTDLSARTKMGGNALHIASEYGSAPVVQMLIEQGLDPKQVDSRTPGWNALDYAKNRVDEDRFQVIAYLTPLVETEGDATEEPGAE